VILISSYETTFAICKGLCRFEGPAGFPAAAIDCTGKKDFDYKDEKSFLRSRFKAQPVDSCDDCLASNGTYNDIARTVVSSG